MKKKIIVFACLSWALATGAYALDEAGEFLRMCQYGSQEQQKTIRAIAAKLKLSYEPANFNKIYENLEEMKYFILSDNLQIEDLAPFKFMKKIQLLRIVNNAIVDLSPLSGLKTLTDLQLSNNKISDIGPLSGLANLEELDIGLNKKISDLRPLMKLTKLRILSAGGNSIEDIIPINEISKLELIILSYNKIKNIRSLEKKLLRIE